MPATINTRIFSDTRTFTNEDDPRTLGLDVRAFDQWHIQDPTGAILNFIYNPSTESWELQNDWDFIRNKPTAFWPEQHDLDPDSGVHAGGLHIKHVLGHDMLADPHDKLLALILLSRRRKHYR